MTVVPSASNPGRQVERRRLFGPHPVPQSSLASCLMPSIILGIFRDLGIAFRAASARAVGQRAFGIANLGDTKAALYFDVSTEYLVLLRLLPSGDLVVEDINPAAEAIIGRRRGDVARLPLVAMTTPESARDMENHARHALGRGCAHAYEARRTVDGRRFLIDVVVAPMAAYADGPTLVLISGRDMSGQRLLEEELRQSRKMDALGQMTGGLVHDFNNLLGAVTASLELMQRNVDRGHLEDLERYMAMAQGAVTRASALTRRMLAFSRKEEMEVVITDVCALASDFLSLAASIVGPTVSLELAEMSDAWSVLVDPAQLENAVLNLCTNARDAMPGGGPIRIGIANHHVVGDAAGVPAGDYLAVSVTDAGVGMAPDVLARSLQPFFTTKPLGCGTGLGLAMIADFVRRAGGSLRIDSRLGLGTTVTLLLPRYLVSDASRSPGDAGSPPCVSRE